jgi:GxxExxY protein
MRLLNHELKYQELTGIIIKCAMEVHTILGNGFQEVIYQRALSEEFALRKIDFRREFEMEIFYKNILLGLRRVDFLVEDRISVELKAVMHMENAHFAQAINYLEVYNLEVGLLLNFGSTKLQFHRLNNKKFKAFAK